MTMWGILTSALLLAAASPLADAGPGRSGSPWPPDAELAETCLGEGRRHAALLAPAGVDPIRKAKPDLFRGEHGRNIDERTQKNPARVDRLAETDPLYLAAWWGAVDGKYALHVSSGLLRFLSETAKGYELARISEDPEVRPREASFHHYYSYLAHVGGGHYVWHPVPAFESLVSIPFPPTLPGGKADPKRDVPGELSQEFLEFIGSALRTPEVAVIAERAIREKSYVDSSEFKDRVAKLALGAHVVERLRLLAVHEALPRTLADAQARADFNEVMRAVIRIPEMADLLIEALASRKKAFAPSFHERVVALSEARGAREKFEALVKSEDFPVLFHGWLAELKQAIRDTNRRLVSAMVAHEIGHLALGDLSALLAKRRMLLGGHDDPQVSSVLRLIEYTTDDERRVDDWMVDALGHADPPGHGLVLLLDAFEQVRKRMLGTNFRYVFLHPAGPDRIPEVANLYFKKGQDLGKLKPYAERVLDPYVLRAADLRKMSRGRK